MEILLTPGVFLCVADNSTVKMISPDLANTRSRDRYRPGNGRIDENGANPQLLKSGLYDFDADHNQVRVFSGKAQVHLNNQKVGLGENRKVTLNAGGKLKP